MEIRRVQILQLTIQITFWGLKITFWGLTKKTPEKTCGAGSFSFLVLTTDTRNPALLGFPPTRQTACHDP